MITNRKRSLLENNETAVACSRDRAGAAKAFHLAVLDLEAELKSVDQLGSRKKRPKCSHLRASDRRPRLAWFADGIHLRS